MKEWIFEIDSCSLTRDTTEILTDVRIVMK